MVLNLYNFALFFSIIAHNKNMNENEIPKAQIGLKIISNSVFNSCICDSWLALRQLKNQTLLTLVSQT